MPTTLRALLAEPAFHLTPRTKIADAVLDAPVTSAHSSDLPDPTAWLESGQLLLTDGVQFLTQQTPPAEYVERLVRRGIIALGFATHIVHDDIPLSVVEACEGLGLPLIQVGDATPFMAIIRSVSDAVAADQRARLEESLRALRAVARAALRPDGLAAVLGELEASLGAWVELFDAAGARVDVPSRLRMPDGARDAVEGAARRALDGGRPAGLRLDLSAVGEVTLQTLGQTGRLRGVLAVGAGGSRMRDDADLVDAAIAFASIALEQSRAFDDARRRLRSGIAALVHAGVLDVAGGAARPLWGDLPQEPIRVGVLDAPPPADRLIAALELLAERRAGRVFYAEHREQLIVVVEEETRPALEELLSAHGVGAGYSILSIWDEFASAWEEARRARGRLGSARFVLFESLAEAGLRGHLEATGAQTVARRMLRPLTTDPASAEDALIPSLQTWLERNGAWDPAARALGIHRHTLRARVDHAGLLLGMDLSTFDARAELWNALRLIDL